MRRLLLILVFLTALILAPLALADTPGVTPSPARRGVPAPVSPIFPPLSDAPAPESLGTPASLPTPRLLNLGALMSLAPWGHIAFSSDRSGDWDVYVMPAQGGLPINLTRDPGWDLYASWSPDGRFIAFSSTRDAPDPAHPEANREIYVMAADGSQVRRLTFHPAADTAPAWSPDGTRIAFVSNRHPINPDQVGDWWEIYAVDVRSGETVRLTSRNGYATDPAWSPDGRHLAYAFSTSPNWTCTTNWDIYVLDLTTLQEQRLTSHCGFDGYPRWSPDGRRMAFTRCDTMLFCLFSRDNDIWTMNPDGTGQVNLTRDDAAQDYFPAWSPDGAHIAFSSDRQATGDTFDVYVLAADGSSLANLTSHPRANDIAPYWAGDPAPAPTPTPPPQGEEPPETIPSLPSRLDDEFYGQDPDPGYKTRAHNPITITLPITRYYGPVDDEGHLLPGALGRSAAAQAELTVMAFDVDCPADSNCHLTPGAEIDRLFLNGQFIGQLTGEDGAWRPVSFPVDVTGLRFPKPGQNGPEVTAANVVTLTVDEAGAGRAVQVAWARLKVPGARPMVLMAGFDSNPLHSGPNPTDTTWGNWVKAFLPGDGLDGFGVNPARDGHASIADGAWYIAPAAQAQLQRFGVEKVDVVGYSMGGLWAREYAWQRPEMVNRVVMIGTPNGGSLWADLAALARDNPQAWIQTACRLDPHPSCAAVGLAAYAAYALAYESLRPAVDELTTDFVTQYNRLHPPRLIPPGARYVTVGGVVPIPLVPPSDLAVGLRSVQALDYAWNLPPWTDWRANHWNLPQDPYIYRYLRDQGVIARPEPAPPFPRSAVAQEVRPALGEPALPPQRLAPLATVITAGQTIVLTQTVDAGTVAQFSLTWINPESRLSLSLVDPSGTQIDPGTSIPNVQYLDMAPNLVSYYVTDPAPGDWLLLVSAESTPKEGEPFVAGATLQSTLEMTARTDRDWYRPGEPIRLTVTLTDQGRPITGAEIVVDVTVEHQPVARATLADDGKLADVLAGDGKYTRALPAAAQGGLYTFAILARGISPDGLPFSRGVRLTVPVSPQTATIAGPLHELTDDTGEGVFDRLEVLATVVVTEAGHYELVGNLTDGEGRLVAGATTEVDLPAGTWPVALRFDGQAIAAAGLNGPYILRELHLLDHRGDFPLQTDFRADALTTGYYAYTQFQRDPIVILGPIPDELVDANADGSHEGLRIGLEVSLREAGEYEISARLTDQTWRTLAVAQKTVQLPVGRSQVFLEFPGAAIWRAGASGPYTVRDVYVARMSRPAEYATAGQPWTTAAYEIADFRPHQSYLPLIIEVSLP